MCLYESGFTLKLLSLFVVALVWEFAPAMLVTVIMINGVFCFYE